MSCLFSCSELHPLPIWGDILVWSVVPFPDSDYQLSVCLFVRENTSSFVVQQQLHVSSGINLPGCTSNQSCWLSVGAGPSNFLSLPRNQKKYPHSCCSNAHMALEHGCSCSVTLWIYSDWSSSSFDVKPTWMHRHAASSVSSSWRVSSDTAGPAAQISHN